jgi:hypothetical protein
VWLLPRAGSPDVGIDIEWRATFDPTLRGRLIRGTIQRIHGEVVHRLVAAAEATSDASSGAAVPTRTA